MAKGRKTVIPKIWNLDIVINIIYIIIIVAYLFYSFFYGDASNLFDIVLLILALLLPSSGFFLSKETKDQHKSTIFILKVLLPIILLISLFIKICNSLDSPIFSKYDKDIKVLILPFKQICEYGGKSYDAGYVINERLNEKKINIKSHYLNNYEVNNLTSEEINDLQQFHNSDMVVFGSLITDDCSKDGDQICLKFKLRDTTVLNIKNGTMANEYEKGTLDDLLKGTIQNKLENIILILSVIGQLKVDNNEEFSVNIDRVINKLDYVDTENTLVMLGDLLYSLGYIGAASKLYVEAGRPNAKNELSGSSFEAIMKYNDIFDQYGFREKTVKDIESYISGVKSNYLIIEGQDTTSDERLIIAYIAAGNDFLRIGEFNKAKHSFDQANKYLLMFDSRKNFNNKISIIIGLAQSYRNLGDILNARTELDKLNEISIISISEAEFISFRTPDFSQFRKR